MKGKYSRLMLGVSGYCLSISVLIFAIINSSLVNAAPRKSKAAAQRVAGDKAQSEAAKTTKKVSPAKQTKNTPSTRRQRVTQTELQNNSGRRVVHISFKNPPSAAAEQNVEVKKPIFDSTTNHPGGMDIALVPREK